MASVMHYGLELPVGSFQVRLLAANIRSKRVEGDSVVGLGNIHQLLFWEMKTYIAFDSRSILPEPDNETL